jgi:hypothetical protein
LRWTLKINKLTKTKSNIHEHKHKH